MDAVGSVESSGMVIFGNRFAAGTLLFLLPPTRILEISDAETLHDHDMGSNGFCGGGIAGTASSSSSSATSMLKALATTSFALLFFSMTIILQATHYSSSSAELTPDAALL
jgi:hypothetical protein